MAQDFSLPVGTARLNVAIKTKIADSLEALRTLHSGTTEPSLMVANMLWIDTAAIPIVLKLRNAANAAWVSLWSLTDEPYTQLEATGHAGTLSATKTDFVGTVPRSCTVSRIVLLSSNASSSSAGNEWQLQLTKYPTASPGSGVTLISAACGTETALGGVGGGSEFVADQGLVFTPNQNATCADRDCLELTLTKVGSATTLNNIRAFIEIL